MYIILCLLSLQACGVRNSANVSDLSYVGEELPNESVITNIVNDLAIYIGQIHAPGHIALNVLTPKENNNAFSVAFDNALRTQGFEISQDASLSITYIVDILENNVWYVQINFNDGLSVACSYDALGMPEAGRTQTNKTKNETVLDKIRDKTTDTVTTVQEKTTNMAIKITGLGKNYE